MEPNTNELASHVKYETGKLIENLEFEDYAKADGANSHGLMDVLRSPAHYYEHRYNRVEGKETEALLFGKLFHYAILEPVLFQKNYVIKPAFDRRTKIGKEAAQIWENTLTPEAIVVPEKFVEGLTRMSQKILTHPKAKLLLGKGVRETTLFWNDRETGELCKMRPDFISEKGHIVDLKTSKDGREDYFSRDILKYKWHIQAAHYCEGARSNPHLKISPDTFIYVVVEKDPPYEIAIYPAGGSVLGVGEQWRSKAMRTYAKCKKANHWPGYNAEMRVIELPQWAESVDPDDGEEE